MCDISPQPCGLKVERHIFPLKLLFFQDRVIFVFFSGNFSNREMLVYQYQLPSLISPNTRTTLMSRLSSFHRIFFICIRKPMGKLRPISPYETALLDETLQEFILRKEKRYILYLNLNLNKYKYINRIHT